MKKRIGFVCLLLVLLMTASTASAHKCSFGSWRVKRSPTCTRTGLKFRYCVGCDHWEQRQMPKLPHEVAEWTITKEATCTEKGGKEGFCSTCENVIRFYIDEIEHEYGEMETIKEPTCVREGQGQYTCTGCGRHKNQTLKALGHDWVQTKVVKDPTCKAFGSGEEICQRCDRERTARIDKLEHEYDDWTVTKEPEGTQKGTRERECLLCGEMKTERFFYEGTLYLDMEPNEDVIRLQEMLRDLGYYDGPIRSGTYGKQTGKAVSRFQKDQGLAATDIADPATIELLEDEWERVTGKSVVEKLNQDEMENAAQAQTMEI